MQLLEKLSMHLIINFFKDLNMQFFKDSNSEFKNSDLESENLNLKSVEDSDTFFEDYSYQF